MAGVTSTVPFCGEEDRCVRADVFTLDWLDARPEKYSANTHVHAHAGKRG